ncbi:MAG: Fe-S protein maturation auxiliary factor SufT [Steroidobacteraceae bacterium]|nr:Fe-S protein maturation auxiliary factor SufT [Steroidobacteraceae bacterium]
MSEWTGDDFLDPIREALRLVIDPELGYNIVDLGLVYEIDVDDGRIAHVTMTTTTRGCPATDYLRSGAHQAAASVTGIASADVTMTYDPPWTPRMMSPQAKEHFGIADD